MRTTAAHRSIDRAYSKFDLGNRDSYIQFLSAHARVVPAIEAALSGAQFLPSWRPRTAALTLDLDTFSYRVPEPLTLRDAWGEAEMLGLLYVLEGSRLGARSLLQMVGLGFSSHYLSAAYKPGDWGAFTYALNERVEVEDASWLEGVVTGALRGFQLYEVAALSLGN